MRIVVNNIAASSGGAMTILRDFYNFVCESDKENEWIFLLSSKYFEETENVKILAMPEIKKNPIKKVLFDLVTGKKFINSLKPDVVFSMQNILTFGLKVPQILYLHQSLPFQKMRKFSFLKKNERSIAFKQYIVGALIKKSVKKAQITIVQTEWMKDAVAEKCNINRDEIIKIIPNVKHLEVDLDSKQFNNKNFFYPTSSVLYKNNDLVFAASQILDEGGFEHSIELTLPQKKSFGNVFCIDKIPYEEVIEKYKSSTLIFPSYIETFGYPLAEARSAGTVVLAADTPFSRELLEGYENAYFFDYKSEFQLASLIEKVIKGEIVRKKSQAIRNEAVNCWESVKNCVLFTADESKKR